MNKHITVSIKCGKNTCTGKVGNSVCSYLGTKLLDHWCQLFDVGLSYVKDENGHKVLRCKKCIELAV